MKRLIGVAALAALSLAPAGAAAQDIELAAATAQKDAPAAASKPAPSPKKKKKPAVAKTKPAPAPPAEEPASAELTWELAAYYTNIALVAPLTGKAIPVSRGDNELEIYRDLFLQSLKPQFVLLEASIYPMPMLGTFVRRQYPTFYGDATVFGANMVEAVTAGFQEPAAVSLFVGSAMNFLRPGEKRKGTNKGHMGYLFSFGTHHIKDNLMIHEPWYEFEWKLKGERIFVGDKLSWSFRVGTKLHSDPDVADTVYFGFKRANLDFRAPVLSWLDNSSINLTVAGVTGGLAMGSAELLLEKRYPIENWGVAVALGTGVRYEAQRLYRNSLMDPDSDLIFVLRPNLEFF